MEEGPGGRPGKVEVEEALAWYKSLFEKDDEDDEEDGEEDEQEQEEEHNEEEESE